MTSWKERKVVVTGAGGFIGSHLVERLLELGADVTALIRYNSSNDLGRLNFIDDAKRQSLHIVAGDIRELETVRGLLMGHDAVFHLAALVSIPYSYVHPNEVVEVNTIGTLNVLTAAKESCLRRVVVTSTSEVYGTALRVPIDESHPKQPQSPYSASKIAADALALSFHLTFDTPVAIVRPFNTYGPRQSDRAIIPTIISQALTSREIVIGNPQPTRDFTFVADTVDGLILAAESDECLGQEINLGAGREISIGDLAERIRSMVGEDVKILREAKERVRPPRSEVERLLSCNAKMRNLTGWRPKVDLDQGLRLTMDWIRLHADLFNPSQYRI
jgi:NAD dependent epimerase/dehydratase